MFKTDVEFGGNTVPPEDPSLPSPTCSQSSRNQSQRGVVRKILPILDRFHNSETRRAPSWLGGALSLLMIPAVIWYVVRWFVLWQELPPVETMQIEWASMHGPFPMEVECKHARCWYHLSGCSDTEGSTCHEIGVGEKATIPMCWAGGPRGGLILRWVNESNNGITSHGAVSEAPGMHVYSEANTWDETYKGYMVMTSSVEPGRSAVTFVRTQNKTLSSDDKGRHRSEWFLTYLSDDVQLSPSDPCASVAPADPHLAQVVLKPEYYDRTLERPSWYTSFMGEFGGFYSIAQTVFMLGYLMFWKLSTKFSERTEMKRVHDYAAEALS